MSTSKTQPSKLRRILKLRSVHGNAAATLTARGMTTISQVVVFALVVREYGAHALDQYAVAFAVATFGGLVLDFGTSLWATREIARGHCIDAFLLARLPLSVLVTLSVAGGVVSGLLTVEQAVAILVIATAMAMSLLARGVFWGQRIHDRETVFAGLESWGLVILLVAAHFGLLPRLTPLLYTAIAYGAGAVGRWASMPAAIRPSLHASNPIAWVREMAPFGMQGLVTTASAQLDVILLSVLVIHPTAGTIAAYALALRVYYASPMPLEALGSALLPRFVEHPERYRRTAMVGTAGGTALAASGAVLFSLIAPHLGYGAIIVHRMREALMVLAFAFLARCSAYVAGAYVTAQGAQRTRLAASLGALVTMVALDLTLIPIKGAIGAAWAMVAADWVLLLGYLVGSRMTAIAAKQNFATHGL
jgi:O-antigen/teichoic acid export membrane protein